MLRAWATVILLINSLLMSLPATATLLTPIQATQLSPIEQNRAQMRSVLQRDLSTIETEIRLLVEQGQTPPEHMIKRRDYLKLQIQRLR